MLGKIGLHICIQQEKNYQNDELFFLGFEKVLKLQASVIENGQFPCVVFGQDVGVNSKLCNGCNKWYHKRCSGLRSLNGSDILCPSCSNQGRTSQLYTSS